VIERRNATLEESQRGIAGVEPTKPAPAPAKAKARKRT